MSAASPVIKPRIIGLEIEQAWRAVGRQPTGTMGWNNPVNANPSSLLAWR